MHFALLEGVKTQNGSCFAQLVSTNSPPYPLCRRLCVLKPQQVHVVKHEHKPTGERLVVMKGAPERIIDRCSEVLLGSRVVPMTPELRKEIEDHQEALSRNGLRVLGCVTVFFFLCVYRSINSLSFFL